MSDLHNDSSPTVIYQRMVPADAFTRIAELEAEVAKLKEDHEREHLKTIDERDEAEEAMSQAYYIVTGSSPEWSNNFHYPEALEEIGDVLSVLKQAVQGAQSENARLAAIEANAIDLCNHWAKSRRWPSGLSPFLSDLNAALAAKERT